MDRTVKIFCSGPGQGKVKERYRVIESYGAFVLAEISSTALAKLRREYVVEDITDLYTLRVGEREIDTSIRRLGVRGAVRCHPAYRGTKPLAPGRHHLVRFLGPIKDAWLAGKQDHACMSLRRLGRRREKSCGSDRDGIDAWR